MHLPKSLLAVMFTYCILAGLYAALVPPWETPDEPAHYRYVTQLAERWRPPDDPGIRQRDRFCRDYTFITSNYEWYHPALGYLPLAMVYRILQLLAPHSLPANIPPFNLSFCSDPFTSPNLFRLEASHPLKVWQHGWGLLILRIASSLWGLVIITVTYQTGKLLEMNGFEIVAAAWVAFLPQFTFISASVRNDTTNNAIAALLLFLIARMQLSERRRWVILITGLTLGTGILTKLTLAYLAPAVLLAGLLPSQSLRDRIRAATCIIVISSIPVALYYLGYPEAWSALSYTESQMKVRPEITSWTYWKPFFPLLLDLFFARFGWANVLVPAWWIRIAFGIWVLGAGFSCYRLACLLKQERKNPKTRILFLLTIGLLLAFVGVIRYNLSHFQPQGRFLFPALVSWALLGTWGLSTALPKQARFPVGLGTMGFMFLFNLKSLITLISVYY